MPRQPLLTSRSDSNADPAPARMPGDARSLKMDNGRKLSLQSAGRENQLAKAGNNTKRGKSLTRSKSRTRSKSEKSRKSSRTKKLLGNVLDSFRRSSSRKEERAPSLSPTSSSDSFFPSSDKIPVKAQRQRQQQESNEVRRVQKKRTPLQEFQDQTSEITDSDASTPMMPDEHDTCCFDSDSHKIKGSNDGPSIETETAVAGDGNQQQSAAETRLRMQQIAAITRLQSLFRGYCQRYEYRMMRLRHKLQQIERMKLRQLTKLAERTKSQMRRERSIIEFQNGQQSRTLQRFTRVIPYLFREAQTKLKENVALMAHVVSIQSMPVEQQAKQIQDLVESHGRLQRIAHQYLESMEDIPGIWEALKAQWMGPKKQRPRRIFGPDGKPRRVDMKKQCNTHDEDLPVDATNDSSAAIGGMDSPQPKKGAAFDDLYIQAHTVCSSITHKDIDQAVHEVNQVLGFLLN